MPSNKHLLRQISNGYWSSQRISRWSSGSAEPLRSIAPTRILRILGGGGSTLACAWVGLLPGAFNVVGAVGSGSRLDWWAVAYSSTSDCCHFLPGAYRFRSSPTFWAWLWAFSDASGAVCLAV